MERHDVLGLAGIPGCDGNAVPRAPGAVELADTGQLIVAPRGDVPALRHPIADEFQEARPAAHLDEELRDRVTLAIEAHQVPGVVLDHEQAGQGELAAALE